jgi:hypothetical protein
MSPKKNNVLAEHFAQLKALMPDVYTPVSKPPSREEALFELLKASLGVMEAVYVQKPEEFTLTKAETYAGIIVGLAKLQIPYAANPAILQMAGTSSNLSKKPMERAKPRSSQNHKKAG